MNLLLGLTHIVTVFSLTPCKSCIHFLQDDLYTQIGTCTLFRHGKYYEHSTIAYMKCNSTYYEEKYN